MARFPKIVDPNKTGPVADPFIIALALFYKNGISGQEPVILTQERNRENRIPFVADHYNVSSLNLLELFNAENWTF